MKSISFVCCALVLLCASVGDVGAQLALRAGGGMIFENSQIGGHGSLVLPFSSKPGGVMIAAEYYKDSGVTTIPVSARGLYKATIGAGSIYIGMGSGLIYRKVEGAATPNLSSTKLLFSAVGGINLKFSGPLGLFGEVTMDRAFVSGADNNLAAKAGLSPDGFGLTGS